MISQTHQVKSAFVGVHPNHDGTLASVTLEPGAIIAVDTARTVLRSGLVEVLFEGTVLTAFMRDIEDRTEPVHTSNRKPIVMR